MNVQKRKMIDAIITLVKSVRDAEEQDLKDTPDSIEFSDASDEFRMSIGHLRVAISSLTGARDVVHARENDG